MNCRFINIIAFIILIILAPSCGHKRIQPGRRELIPEKELIPLLTDLYIADGLLQYPLVRNMFSSKDTISSYVDIISKHGYTKERVDQTLKYYFVNDPKELQKIYDEVLARLSEIQSRIETVKVVPKIKNLWESKASFTFPGNDTDNNVGFNIPISDTGFYYLSFSAIVYKADQSLNPRITVFFWKPDSAGRQKKLTWSSVNLIKDDLRHNYTVTGKLSDTTFRHIGGFLFDCDPQKVKREKYAKISDIRLIKGVPE